MSDSVFNLSPETMKKIRDSQSPNWAMRPGPNGEEPPQEQPEDQKWSHHWHERLVIQSVGVEDDANKVGRKVVQVRVACNDPESPNNGRVMTDFSRLDPPEGGEFNIMTQITLRKLAGLMDALGLTEEAELDLLGALQKIPAGSVVVGDIKIECRFNRKRGEYFTGQEVNRFYEAA